MNWNSNKPPLFFEEKVDCTKQELGTDGVIESEDFLLEYQQPKFNKSVNLKVLEKGLLHSCILKKTYAFIPLPVASQCGIRFMRNQDTCT